MNTILEKQIDAFQEPLVDIYYEGELGDPLYSTEPNESEITK